MSDPQTTAWLQQILLATSTATEIGLSTNTSTYVPDPNEGKITIDQLLNDQAVILQKENDDRDRLNIFFSPTLDSLKPTLLAWAKKGFPSVEKVSQVILDPPRICSDGQIRTIPYYVEYILNDTLVNCLNKVNAITVGMTFTYSWIDSTVCLHVSRN